MLRRRAVAGSVVLVDIPGAGHQEVGAGEGSSMVVDEINLRDDVDAHHPVEYSQHRLSAGLRPWVGDGVRRRQRARPWSATGEYDRHPFWIDVAQRLGGVHENDQIKVAEVPSRAEQDLLRGVDREPLHCATGAVWLGGHQARTDQACSTRSPLASVHGRKDGDGAGQVRKSPTEEPGRGQVREDRVLRQHQLPGTEVPQELVFSAQPLSLGEEQSVTDPPEAAQSDLTAYGLVVVSHTARLTRIPVRRGAAEGTCGRTPSAPVLWARFGPQPRHAGCISCGWGPNRRESAPSSSSSGRVRC